MLTFAQVLILPLVASSIQAEAAKKAALTTFENAWCAQGKSTSYDHTKAIRNTAAY
jgi:hypothetical protein